jgi:hypothetical protein
VKKSEVIFDLAKIEERLELMLESSCLESYKNEVVDAKQLVKGINEKLKSDCLTYSITARAKQSSDKCRFCGR